MKKLTLILIIMLLGTGTALGQMADPATKNIELMLMSLEKNTLPANAEQSPEAYVKELAAKAEDGDAESQRLLGLMYWLGANVEQDDDEAFDWLEMAALQGDVEAQKAVSGFYYLGTGVRQNLTQAFEWMLKAAQAGDADAQVLVAQYYYEGRGVKQNLPKTLEWLEKATAQGSKAGQEALAKLNELIDGKVTRQRHAVPSAISEGLFNDAVAYLNGHGVEKNPQKAFELASQAASHGNVDAYMLIGNMYYEGRPVTRNYKKALEWFLRAAEYNHHQAQYFASIMYTEGIGTKVDFVEAYKWILIAWESIPGTEIIERQKAAVRSRISDATAGKAQYLANQWLAEWAEFESGHPATPPQITSVEPNIVYADTAEPAGAVDGPPLRLQDDLSLEQLMR